MKLKALSILILKMIGALSRLQDTNSGKFIRLLKFIVYPLASCELGVKLKIRVLMLSRLVRRTLGLDSSQ
jgi:hypothetical protein